MPGTPRDTKLTRELAAAKLPAGPPATGQVAIERIHIKKTDREEIRFSRWEGAKLLPRALAIREEELLPLLEAAVRAGVFSPEFVGGLRRALAEAPATGAAAQDTGPTSDLGRIEKHFHELIRARARDQLGEAANSLPRLVPDIGTENDPAWFAVDGMDGGFKYWWDSSAAGPRLMSESWSRTVSGSGQLHEITPAGSRLLAEGFI
jgi:hypothetical protein